MRLTRAQVVTGLWFALMVAVLMWAGWYSATHGSEGDEARPSHVDPRD